MRSIPGPAPKETTPGSITIANGKTQMDFAGDVFHNPEVDMPTDLPFFNQAELGSYSPGTIATEELACCPGGLAQKW